MGKRHNLDDPPADPADPGAPDAAWPPVLWWWRARGGAGGHVKLLQLARYGSTV